MGLFVTMDTRGTSMSSFKPRMVVGGAVALATFELLGITQAAPSLAMDEVPPDVIRATVLADGRTQIAWDAAAATWLPGTTSWWVSPSDAICENHINLSYSDHVVNEPTCIVSGLAPGQTVTVYMGEWNPTYGALKVASNIPVGAPTQVPLAPVLTATTAGNTTATVSWNPPTNSAQTGALTYTVQATPGGVVCTTAETTCEVTGLVNDQAVTFAIIATGPGGASPAAVSGPVLPQASVPGPPRSIKARRAGRNVTVTWQAPKATGGSPVTGYVVTASPGGRTCKASKPTGCTIKNLTIGTTYSFAVEASNAKGTGSAATSEKLTIPKPPPPPKHSVAIS